MPGSEQKVVHVAAAGGSSPTARAPPACDADALKEVRELLPKHPDDVMKAYQREREQQQQLAAYLREHYLEVLRCLSSPSMLADELLRHTAEAASKLLPPPPTVVVAGNVVKAGVVRVVAKASSPTNNATPQQAVVVKATVKPASSPSSSQSSPTEHLQSTQPAEAVLATSLEHTAIKASQQLLQIEERRVLELQEQLKRSQLRVKSEEAESLLWRRACHHLLWPPGSPTSATEKADEASGAEGSEPGFDEDKLMLALIVRCGGTSVDEARLLSEEKLKLERIVLAQKEELKAMKDRTAALEGQIERISSMPAESPDMKKESADLKARLEARNKQVRDAAQQQAKLEKEVTELKTRLEARNKQLNDGAQQQAKLEKEVTALQQDNASLLGSVREMKENRSLEVNSAPVALLHQLRQSELQSVQLKRAFEERRSRYDVEASAWSDRERIWQMEATSVLRRAAQLQVRVLVLEELLSQAHPSERCSSQQQRSQEAAVEQLSDCTALQGEAPSPLLNEEPEPQRDDPAGGSGVEEGAESLQPTVAEEVKVEDGPVEDTREDGREGPLSTFHSEGGRESELRLQAEVRQLRTMVRELQQTLAQAAPLRSGELSPFVDGRGRRSGSPTSGTVSPPEECIARPYASVFASPLTMLEDERENDYQLHAEIEVLRDERDKLKVALETQSRQLRSQAAALAAAAPPPPVSKPSPLFGGFSRSHTANSDAGMKHVQLLLQETLREKMDLEERVVVLEQRLQLRA